MTERFIPNNDDRFNELIFHEASAVKDKALEVSSELNICVLKNDY
jgi:hypothetical protein